MRVAVGAERHAAHRVGVPGQRLADGLAGGRVPQPHRLVGAAGGDAGAVGAERHAGHRARCGRSAAAPTGWPVAASHSRTVLSPLPEARRVPSGLNATLDTVSGVAGQRLADGLAGGGVPQPHRLVGAAGGDAGAVGAERHAASPRPVWPVSGWPMGWPVAASHSRTVLSSLPEARRVPSGLNATLHTASGVAGQRLADGLAGGRVPQPHRLVGAAGGEARAVGAERHARTPRPVWPVSGWPIGLAGGRVPQPHRAVAAAGGEARAVGAERHARTPRRCARSAAGRWVGRWPRPTAAPSCRRCRRRCGVPSGLNATLFTRSGVPGERLADGLAGGRVPQPHASCRRCRRRGACRRG